MIPKSGTVRHSSEVDFSQDFFNRSHAKDPGFYVVGLSGMWKGPFETAEQAKQAYKEWAWEAKHS